MELEICSVCLSSISNEDNLDQNITTKCCYKKFHRKCFTECMKIKLECPLCRGNQTDHIIVIDTYSEPHNYNKTVAYIISSAFVIFIFGIWSTLTKR